METHNCIICGKPITKEPKDTPTRYKERKYCSKECSSQWKRPTKEVKSNFCQQCGQLITKKPYESINRYYSRKFCSQKCTKAYLKEHGLGWYAYGSLRLSYKEKPKKEKELPPVIWTDRDFKDFYDSYPELSQF